MTAKRIWVFGLIPLAVASMAIAGVGSYCTRPRCRTGIPTRDYQYGSQSPSATALSTVPLPLRATLTLTDVFQAEDRATVLCYQLDRARLTVDHCSISEVAFQMRAGGEWVISLRADQNPQPKAEATVSATPTDGFTSHLKRNQFVVKVRFYGAFAEEPQPAADDMGRPVLFELEPIEFWVQSGRPYHFSARGTIAKSQRSLSDLVDRVEIEFFYR